MPVDQVVDMVPVRDRFVSATFSVLVVGFMGRTFVIRGAVGWVAGTHRQFVLVKVVRMGVVEVSIMKIIHVAFMPHGCVAAVLSVHMIVVFVLIAGHVWILQVATWIRTQRSTGIRLRGCVDNFSTIYFERERNFCQVSGT